MSIPGVECARRRRFHQRDRSSPSSDTGAPTFRWLLFSPPVYRSSSSRHNPAPPLRHSHSPHPHPHRNRHFAPGVRPPQPLADPWAADTSQEGQNLGQRDVSSGGPTRLQSLNENGRLIIDNELHGVALAARHRLDERLRATDLPYRRYSTTSLPGGHEQAWYGEEEISGASDDGRNQEVSHLPTLNIPISGRGACAKVKKGLTKAAIAGLPKERYSPECESNDKGGREGASYFKECPVCLDYFSLGQLLIRLPCKHKFHCECLTPWLERHSQCPYCRANVISKGPLKGFFDLFTHLAL